MARMFQYVRPVNAVLTSVSLGKTPDPSENGIRIKEEPPDLDYDNLNYLLSDANTTATNVSTKSQHHHLDVANNENNERILRSTSVCSNKDSSNSTRKKRKCNLNDSSESQNSQPAKKSRLFLRDILPLQTKDESMTLKSKCKICFVSFATELSLNAHLRRYNTLFTCEICNSLFNSHHQLQTHLSGHFRASALYSKKLIGCWYCERTFRDIKHVQIHLFHCHRSLLEAEYLLKTDIAKFLENMEDLCKIKNDSRISNNSIGITKNIDKIEKNTRREDTTVRVTRNSDKIRRNMETSLIREINDVERNSAPMEDSTMPVPNSIDQTKQNKRVGDAMVRIPSDAIKIINDTRVEDAEISVTDDVELLEGTESTTMQDILNIIGIVNNSEEGTSIEDSANHDRINDANEIKENRRVEDNVKAVCVTNDSTNMAAVQQPCSNNDAANVAGVTNCVAEVISVTIDTTNMVNVCNDVDKIKESANCVTPVEGSANRVISDIVKNESSTSIENIADSVINDVDQISQNTVTKASASRVTTKINETQRNVPIVKSVDRTEEVVQKTERSRNTPTKLDTSSPGRKKMRQTTLTEFLSFSNKSLKEDGIKLEKVDILEESFDPSVRSASRNLTFDRTSTPKPNLTVKDAAFNTPTDSTPLLKMHMNPDSLVGLLSNQIKSEPVEPFQNSPYNLRKSTHDSRRSSVDSHDATPSSVASMRYRSTNTAKRTRKTTMRSLEERWKNKYKCKECVVRLERCDYVFKRVLLKSERSESIIPLQLTIGSSEGTTRNGKVMKHSNPKIRIVNFDNCIVVELLESI